MTNRVLALTSDGRMTYCSCSPEQRGKGRCNHVFHQKEGETEIQFCQRVTRLAEEQKAKEEEAKRIANKPFTVEGKKELIDSNNKEAIEKLLKEETDIEVKRELIMAGYGLDQYSDDPDTLVREAVAKKGYNLEKFVNDPDSDVRYQVAKHGYGLDKLVNDPDSSVREQVAKYGYGLDKLVNDPDFHVREIVAEHGYGLEKLVNDPDWRVTNKAISKIKDLKREAGDGPFAYEEIYNEVKEDVDILDGLDRLRYGIKEYADCMKIVKSGGNIDKFINSDDYQVRVVVAHGGRGLDKLVNDGNSNVRLEVAKQGYGLDKLINDRTARVRAAVAEQGYGLDKLINDKDPRVREAVAEQRYGLDKLMNDEDSSVLAVMIRNNYHREKFVNHKSKYVRELVASRGYGIDKFVKTGELPWDAKDWMGTHNISLDEYIKKVEETGGYDWVEEYNKEFDNIKHFI